MTKTTDAFLRGTRVLFAMTLERVQKIMASCGIASRRKCEEFIQDGLVKVNGTTITIGDKADIDVDTITFNDEPIVKQKLTYLMLNKPKGYITTSSDLFERETVLDILPKRYLELRVFPVGRLDRDTEGLLLLTNDGNWANNIAHPRYEVTKTYRVWLDVPISEMNLESIRKGVTLEEGTINNIQIKPNSAGFLDITLHVGWHKVVKRIFNEYGYRVKGLKRMSIGKLKLPLHMRPGDFRELSIDKRKLVFE